MQDLNLEVIGVTNRSTPETLAQLAAMKIATKLETLGFETELYIHKSGTPYLNLVSKDKMIKMQTPQLTITPKLISQNKIRIRGHHFGLNGYEPSTELKQLVNAALGLLGFNHPITINQYGFTLPFDYSTISDKDLHDLIIKINAIWKQYESTDMISRMISGELHIQTKAYNYDNYINGLNDDGIPNKDIFEHYADYIEYGTSYTHHIGANQLKKLEEDLTNGNIIVACRTTAIQSNNGIIEQSWIINGISNIQPGLNRGTYRIQLELGECIDYKFGEPTAITSQWPTKYLRIK